MNNKVLIIGRVSIGLGGIATGGISKHIEDLSYSLVEKGIEPYIWDFKIYKSFSINNINIVANSFLSKFFNVFHSIFILNILFSKKYNFFTLKDKFIISLQIYSLLKIIEQLEISTIHIHSLTIPITSIIRTYFPNINIITTDHGFWNSTQISNNKYLIKINKNIFCSNKIITISKYAIENFRKYSLSLDKATLIPNPIRLSMIPFHQRTNNNVILFNGINESIRIKNLDKLVEALKSDTFFNNYQLIAIVNNKGKEYLTKAKVNFDIKILSSQSWSKVIGLYGKSKVTVVPSKSESFGLVYLESLVTGTPIVGFHRVLEEFEEIINIKIGEKYNYKADSIRDLANKIKKVLENSYESNSIRDRILQYYDWNIRIDEFINLYKFKK